MCKRNKENEIEYFCVQLLFMTVAEGSFGSFIMQARFPYMSELVVYNIYGDGRDFFGYLDKDHTEYFEKSKLPESISLWKMNGNPNWEPHEWDGLCKIIYEILDRELSERKVIWQSHISRSL